MRSVFGIPAIVLLLLVPAASDGPAYGVPERPVTLAAVGDVFFCRGVAQYTTSFGFDYPFRFTANILSGCDLAFCNLECALSTRGTPLQKRHLFRADPSAALALSNAGFDVISVANNHSGDFGPDALTDTVSAIASAGMTPVGTWLPEQGDSGLRIVERSGLKVGFLALSDFDVTEEEMREGCPAVMQVDTKRLPRQVSEAKGSCDVLIVSVHWGVDYLSFWTRRQQMIAQMCIDNGADLVLGHHPHVLQDVRTYRGKTIVYSMGAFVWDSATCGADRSGIYVFELAPGEARLLETIPVRIVDCQPVVQ